MLTTDYQTQTQCVDWAGPSWLAADRLSDHEDEMGPFLEFRWRDGSASSWLSDIRIALSFIHPSPCFSLAPSLADRFHMFLSSRCGNTPSLPSRALDGDPVCELHTLLYCTLETLIEDLISKASVKDSQCIFMLSNLIYCTAYRVVCSYWAYSSVCVCVRF